MNWIDSNNPVLLVNLDMSFVEELTSNDFLFTSATEIKVSTDSNFDSESTQIFDTALAGPQIYEFPMIIADG